MPFSNQKLSPLAETSPGQWTTGLFNCREDVPTSFVACFCPCVTFGQNAEIISRGKTSCCKAGLISTLLLGFACFYTLRYRAKLRGHHSLPPAPCGDCLVHTFGLPLALCQEHRELKNRGFDPIIGWAANADKMMHQPGGAMKVPTISAMIR
ncbi:protein PLANT CADMIUM RESISTANCE 7-like [Punica granatum]|uniref:Protein PLANT CADMIUM RESISTANCE 7-like n=1 Tax=Punica granatum TaxID=22663 RepID=A0A6P8EBJ8_PUNGR|nr:protein PLANT CADMIUM RESISTANCE 7-like [Punica granatum]